jgi:hypothetical protein
MITLLLSTIGFLDIITLIAFFAVEVIVFLLCCFCNWPWDCCLYILFLSEAFMEARGSVIGWGSKLQAGRSRVRNLIRSLDFFNLTNSSAALRSGVYPASKRNEYQKQKKFFLGVEHGQRIRLTTSPLSVSQLSRQCGILDISQPIGLSRGQL